MIIRCVLLVVEPPFPLDGLSRRLAEVGIRLGAVASGDRAGPSTSQPDDVFVVPGAPRGIAADDPSPVVAAAALATAHARETLVVATRGHRWATFAEQVGAHVLVVRPEEVLSSEELVEVILGAVAEPRSTDEVGVGPHPEPWPDDDRLDTALLAAGDRRNVIDRYRYWREDAIVADLDRRRRPFHVAIENWQHDLNIGTVVRNANAFDAAGVHIVGKRRWNRRGAMATDRYLHVHHHPTVEAFVGWAAEHDLGLVGIDNVPAATPLDAGPLPERCVLVFGQEGPGLSAPMVAACVEVREIVQGGSTRSLNAGVASGIAMHAWTVAHPRLGRHGEPSRRR